MKIDNALEKITNLENNLVKKVGNHEFSELKEAFNQAMIHIDYMKENVSQLIEDRRMQDDYNFIRKKVETLTATVNGLKSEEVVSHKPVVDSNHFVDRLFFSDFQQNLKKEFELTKELMYKEIKNLSTDMFSELKMFVKEKDLKLLEGIYNN